MTETEEKQHQERVEKTNKILADMFSRKLDSLKAEAESVFKWDSFLGLSVEHSTYHLLSQSLEYDPKLDRRLQNWINASDLGNFEAVDGFPQHLKRAKVYVTGRDGDETIPVAGFSTHSGESCLSTEVYFNYFEIEGQGYVVLGLMGNNLSVDRPRVFKTSDEMPTIFDYGRIVVVCSKPDGEEEEPTLPGLETATELPERIVWESDNGGSTFTVNEGDSKFFHVVELEDYEVSFDCRKTGKGFIYFDAETQKAYCPVTGWELVPSFY